MSLKLDNYEQDTRNAVKHFWISRHKAMGKKGGREAVTTGKNMDGFIQLVETIVKANGLSASCVLSKKRSILSLPGYFRPAKNWDILVLDDNTLVGLIEFKSQVGSFGNNFNNRCEEALGSATDLRFAFQKNVFDLATKPFLGYLILIEDCPDSRKSVQIVDHHFKIDRVFENTSYLERYRIFCERLVREGLYDSAALLASSQQEGSENGKYQDFGKLTSLKTFVSNLAGAVAAYQASKI